MFIVRADILVGTMPKENERRPFQSYHRHIYKDIRVKNYTDMYMFS